MEKLQRLERSARYWFLDNLEKKSNPCFDETTSEFVEHRIVDCLIVGILPSIIGSSMIRAWNKAYRNYSSQRLDY